MPACGDAGVVGPLVGRVGSMMATEAIKLITGVGEPLLGRLLFIDVLASTQREIPLVARGPRRARPVPDHTPATTRPPADEACGAAALPRRPRHPTHRWGHPLRHRRA
uniref:Uncharacterized protein n=1 Tax=Janibacter limosus TaxID=53458 RepID=A0AC61U8U2_9MICO|nr:hypothetical protein [Janibacter limosus]